VQGNGRAKIKKPILSRPLRDPQGKRLYSFVLYGLFCLKMSFIFILFLFFNPLKQLAKGD
jgi:hypothetical protein